MMTSNNHEHADILPFGAANNKGQAPLAPHPLSFSKAALH
jgi:hypothetical protein